MEVPTVYIADARARSSAESLISKFDTLIEIELKDKISKGDLVAVKTHMGAPLSTRYIRPFYVRRLVEHLKNWGAKPFVTDTTGLGLTNPRGTAQKYLEIATSHGFTQETMGGAPIIIADGQFGTDITTINFEGHLFKEVTFAKMLTKVDFLISVAHFTGHVFAGPAGAIKNIGMGCAGKTSKGLVHFTRKPQVNPTICDGSPEYSIAPCIAACPVDVVKKENNKAVIDEEKCIFCYACVVKCPKKAIETERTDNTVLQRGIADLATAFVNTIGGKIYNFNFLLEIDWNCDCEHLQKGWNDLPIVPDIGILGSSDPLAIDQASCDLINAATGIPGSMAEECGVLESGADKLEGILKEIDYRNLLIAAEKIGLGSREYKLEKIQPSQS